MQEISMMNNRNYLITDKERVKIETLKEQGYKGLVRLSTGESISLSAIVAISEPEMEAYFMGGKMNKDQTKVFIGGDWKAFAGDRRKIEYRYKNKIANNYKKLK